LAYEVIDPLSTYKPGEAMLEAINPIIYFAAAKNYTFTHWWNGWFHRHPGTFFTTVMVTLAALATLVLAINARKQIKVNEKDNQRRYLQTQHQINLQYRASFYEEALVYLEDSIYALVEVALEINFPFEDVTQSTSSDRKSVLSPYAERVLPNRLLFHATEEVNTIIIEWILRYKEEEGRINVLHREKTSNPTVDFQDALHQKARSEFQDGLVWLVEELIPIKALMKSELHPNSDVLPTSRESRSNGAKSSRVSRVYEQDSR
jgi:hypothetical protein